MPTPHYPEHIQLDEVEQALNRIADALLKTEADFLFGAGMSAASGVPIGNALARELLEFFFPEAGSDPPSAERRGRLAGEYPFEAVVQAVAHERGTRNDLTAALKEILWKEKYDITEEHRDLSALSNWGGSPRLRRIFTTNFDLLLEKAFGMRAFPIMETNASELRKQQDAGKIPIIYLHGHLDGKYYVTEQDVYETDYSIVRTEFLLALIEAAAFVFVGYSMSDPDFRRVYMDYRSIIAGREERGKRTFFVAPALDKYAYRLGRVVWKERGATWLPFDAATFFQELKRYADQRITKEVRVQILRKHGLREDDVDAFNELVKRTQEVLLVDEGEAIRFLYEARTRTGAKK